MEMNNVEDIYPLSPMQQGMLFHNLSANGNDAYVEQFSCELNDEINIQAFENAWQKLVERHTILRTVFISKNVKEPVQVVLKKMKIKLKFYDLKLSSKDEQISSIEAYRIKDKSRKFDLSHPPLIQLTLLQIEEKKYYFIWTYHHILLDGWSMPILLNEFFFIYNAVANDELLNLPAAVPFKEYIKWIKKQDAETSEKYWKALLKDFKTPNSISGCYTKNDTIKIKERQLFLSEQITAKVNLFCRRNNLTVNNLVQSVWIMLISCYSGNTDVLFGSTVSGRPHDLTDSENMVGLFINTLPVRAQVTKNKKVIDLLIELREQQIFSHQYSYSPLTDIQKWSEVSNGAGLFDTLLVYENYPIKKVAEEKGSSLKIQNIEMFEKTNFPLNFIAGIEKNLLFRLAYDAGKIDDDTIGQMLKVMENILTQFISNPDEKLGNINFINRRDENEIISWLTGKKEKIKSGSIVEAFEQMVFCQPNEISVRFKEKYLSYYELNSNANKLARHFIGKGIETEDKIGIAMPKSPEMITAIMAVLKTGAAYIPIDISIPYERKKYIVEDSKIKMIITDIKEAANYKEFSNIKIVIPELEKEEIIKMEEDDLEIKVEDNSLAYIIYTSGSTGNPKGVLVEQRGVVNLANAYGNLFTLNAASRVLQYFSPAFDGAVADIFPALLNGSTLVLIDNFSLMTANEIKSFINNYSITNMILTPSTLNILLADVYPYLKNIGIAGEQLHSGICEKWKDKNLINVYGPTEATVASTAYQINENKNDQIIPIGKALQNIQNYILDEELRILPVNSTGEICIGGIGIARGYLNNPALTAEKFIPDPYSKEPGKRLYKTGDLGKYTNDGNIIFLGRTDNQVKLRGFRIELEEIENQLRLFNQIENCAVIISLFNNRKILVAYYSVKDQNEIDETEIKEFISDKLPYYMIPSAFIQVDSFKITINGKIDKKSLPEPKPEELLILEVVNPRNITEQKLNDLWKIIFDGNNYGVTNNFFEVGGNSLSAIRLSGLVEQTFNIALPIAVIYQKSTIEELAEYIEAQKLNVNPEENILIELKKGNDEVEPLFLIHPSGGSVHWYSELAANIISDRKVYGIQAQGIDGTSDLDDSIIKMAGRYVNIILNKQPEGPYFIGGWSFGVIVAFEVAQQLSALNKKMGAVFLLDQEPVLDEKTPKDNAELLYLIFKDSLSLDLNNLKFLHEEEQFKIVLKKAKKAGMVPFYVRLNQFKIYIMILKTMRFAWYNYKPAKYKGDLIIFRSKENPHQNSKSYDLGWGKLSENVKVIEVPGDHISMMNKANVSALARLIDEFMEIPKSELIKETILK